jgi:hypothetical protein
MSEMWDLQRSVKGFARASLYNVYTFPSRFWDISISIR